MRSIVAIVVVVLPGAVAAQDLRQEPSGVGAAVDRGLRFLAKDALAWRSKHNCVSCHHQSMTSMAANLAFERGIRSNTASLRRILDATLRALEPEISKCYEGIMPEPNRPQVTQVPISADALRIVLFGLPHAGKSSLLGALAQAGQTQENLLPGHLTD